MDSDLTDLVINGIEADYVSALQDELLSVYAEVYANRLGDPFSTVPRYWQRLQRYASRKGFSLVTGSLQDGTLIGYSYGFTLPPGARWWRGYRDRVNDPELFVEDGKRTFALVELMIRERWRRRGYARALHDALLDGRPEERATLLVRPDNLIAKIAYTSWGWRKLGQLQPFPDSPLFDAMMRNLG